jgi:hypothetical protein
MPVEDLTVITKGMVAINLTMKRRGARGALTRAAAAPGKGGRPCTR